MRSKLLDNKKRNHAQKILQSASKSPEKAVTPKASSNRKADNDLIRPLREQYGIIRKDFIQLKDDLTKGYDLAKGMIEKKGLISKILKTK